MDKCTNQNFSIVCFGGEDWWYHNRGHIDMQLMKRFAKTGSVIYVNSIVMQKLNPGQGVKLLKKIIRKTKSILTGCRKIDRNFWVYSPVSLPLHHIRWAGKLNEMLLRFQILRLTNRLQMHNPVIWVACPPACDTAIGITKSKIVYQRTDYYERFPNVDSQLIEACDRKLKANADLTIFVNAGLYNKEAGQCKTPLYLDHGVDYELFASAENDPAVPSDIAGIKHPIVGWFGEISDHTVNIELIRELAQILSDMSFVLIGNQSANYDGLAGRKNLRLLGRKPYEQIPHYGKFFDVAIMPFRQIQWIQMCNPIKLKEYLALGKPIVSTPFSELQKYSDLVYQAQTAADFAGCIRKAIQQDSSDLIAARRKKVATASWDNKAKTVLEKLFPNQAMFQEV